MLQEVPCRDTDPDPGLAMDIKEEDRDSPVAFTINFGGGEETVEEKNKRMERFALRSSQRKPRSPRLEPRGVQGGNKTKVRAMVSEPLQKTFLREKSELALREKEQVVDKVEGSRRVTTVISPGREVMDFTKERRVTRVVRKGCGGNESDESDEERNPEGEVEEREGEGSGPSETGTYTVEDKEEAGNQSPLALASLEVREEDKSSYVAEWASKHAFGPPSPQGDHHGPPSPLTTTSSLSCKSRRKLPPTPHSLPTHSPEVLTFTPDSSLSPPHQEDSEDESSFMTHTQHLVDVIGPDKAEDGAEKRVEVVEEHHDDVVHHHHQLLQVESGQEAKNCRCFQGFLRPGRAGPGGHGGLEEEEEL